MTSTMARSAAATRKMRQREVRNDGRAEILLGRLCGDTRDSGRHCGGLPTVAAARPAALERAWTSKWLGAEVGAVCVGSRHDGADCAGVLGAALAFSETV